MKTLDPDFPVFEISDDYDEQYMLVREIKPNIDTAGREYEMVTQCLENTDFYQGLNMVTVIRRKSDGRLFGYSWWDDISKYGEAYIQSNGDEFGLECDTTVEGFDWDDYVSYYVFEPVVESSIISYNFVEDK